MDFNYYNFGSTYAFRLDPSEGASFDVNHGWVCHIQKGLISSSGGSEVKPVSFSLVYKTCPVLLGAPVNTIEKVQNLMVPILAKLKDLHDFYYLFNSERFPFDSAYALVKIESVENVNKVMNVHVLYGDIPEVIISQVDSLPGDFSFSEDVNMSVRFVVRYEHYREVRETSRELEFIPGPQETRNN